MEEKSMETPVVVGEIQTQETMMAEEFAKCAQDVIIEIATGLQKFVYVREEGNPDNPDDAIIMAPFAMINNILVEIAKSHGVKGFSPDSSGLEKFEN